MDINKSYRERQARLPLKTSYQLAQEDKIPRPQSAFFIYLSDMRMNLREDHPEFDAK